MRVFQPEEFEKMARMVVDAYLRDSSVPMEQMLVKTALNNGLNPDQIRNLVQLANTMAHLTLFDRKSGDKVVEFEPADPSSVLKKIYHEEPASTEVPESDPFARSSDMFGDLGKILGKVRSVLDQNASTSTEPSSESPNESPEVEVLPRKKETLIIKIRKVAEALNDRRLQCAYEYKEELDKLAATFAKLYGPKLEEFEKDAVAVRGNAAFPILADIRRCLRMDPIEKTAFVKTARVVDTETPEMKSLDQLIKLAKKFEDTAAGQRYMQKEFGRWL